MSDFDTKNVDNNLKYFFIDINNLSYLCLKDIIMISKEKECTSGLETKMVINGYKVNYGVIDRSNQMGFYVECGGWAEFYKDEFEIKLNTTQFKAQFRQALNRYSEELFGARIDCNRTLRTYVESIASGMIVSKMKTSYFGVELYFFVKDLDMRKEGDKAKIEELCQRIIQFFQHFKSETLKFHPVKLK